MKKAAEDKTFILELKNGGIRQITIPATWKLTFGQLVPHTLRETHGASSMVALRIYEGSKENLRAVMTDVISIRDTAMAVREKRTTVQRKVAQKHTAHGAKDVVVEARVTEWINPDADEDDAAPNEFLKLTEDRND
ncbi:MAG: hypothetical protein J2P55_01140 [Rhizobiales bacterium]|nr:hypothetical protein [Hyphomicrobiales bacterium]